MRLASNPLSIGPVAVDDELPAQPPLGNEQDSCYAYVVGPEASLCEFAKQSIGNGLLAGPEIDLFRQREGLVAALATTATILDSHATVVEVAIDCGRTRTDSLSLAGWIGDDQVIIPRMPTLIESVEPYSLADNLGRALAQSTRQ